MIFELPTVQPCASRDLIRKMDNLEFNDLYRAALNALWIFILNKSFPNYRRGIKRRGSASRLCRMSKLTDEARGCDYEIRILGICTADPEPDGLHPSDAGCIVMAAKIQAFLESI